MAFDKENFDLFAFLGQLNKRDMHAYEKLSEEGKKAAHPFVIMRWLSGTSDQAQIVRLNATANRCMFALGEEKGLLFKLLAAACTGPKRNQWIKGPGSSKSRLATEAITARFGCSTRESEEHLGLLEPTDVLQFAEEAGWEKDQLKKLQVELGIETVKVKPKKK
jgi:hypothetical protein